MSPAEFRMLLANPAVRAALRAPHGSAQSFPIGHFDIYGGRWFEEAISEQTAFLRRHLIGDAANPG